MPWTNVLRNPVLELCDEETAPATFSRRRYHTAMSGLGHSEGYEDLAL
jgi:hypothetical protein